MKFHLFKTILCTVFVALTLTACAPKSEQQNTEIVPPPARDPLPSWNEGPTKHAIVSFVNAVTEEGSENFVSIPERIATFDNDGTLWAEYPIYSQAYYAVDRVKTLAPQHPEWATTPPFSNVLEGGMEALGKSSVADIATITMVSHAGMNVSEFNQTAGQWLRKTKHHKFNRPYAQAIYQPQLELLDYLRAHDFKVFIVSGGGIGFIRAVSEEAYGIPPEQVVGSVVATKFQMQNGKSELIRLPSISFVDDKAGKPVGIYEHIGRRPILAFGNSDADMQMIEYTKGGDGLRLGLFVHHTDAQREYAYDRQSHAGLLNKALDIADENDWIVVDMKKDWKVIFPPKTSQK